MLNEMFDQFNDMYGLERRFVTDDQESMSRLVCDEFDEMCEEILLDQNGNGSASDFVKEAIDIVYITCQQLRERGVDVDSALAEVHRSNMSKLVKGSPSNEVMAAKSRYPSAIAVTTDSGVVIKCQDTGKVIKPTTYSPAFITDEMVGFDGK